MSRYIKEFAQHLNNIRSQYVASHNQICSNIEKTVKNYRMSTGFKNIKISDSTKKEIENKIFYMQRRSVTSLEFAIELFLYGLTNCNRKNDYYQKRFSKTVIEDLEQLFSVTPYPTELDRSKLAERHSLSFKQVTNWFTNKRNRSKSTDTKFYSSSFSTE